MVAVAAYYLAEQRGFTPGKDVEDWLRAEQYIDDMVRGLARTGIARGGHERVQPIPSDRPGLRRDALQALGVKRFLLAIHDASFPSDPDEDIGWGAPGTVAAARLLAFVARFGFTGIQLGPKGQTTKDNPSPYDGTVFSRSVLSIPLATFRTGLLAGTVSTQSLARAAETTSGTTSPARADHARAHATMRRLLEEAFTALESAARREVQDKLTAFQTENAQWVERDALYHAIAESRGGVNFRRWPRDGDLFARGAEDPAANERLSALRAQHRGAIDRYVLGQMLAHDAHTRFRETARRNGLSIFADMQAGLSQVDTWAWRSILLDGYAMGAPPSRTTPQGQPWGYAVLDPKQLFQTEASGRVSPGPALRFLALRFEKILREYDGVRVDHPHALVCPWVYRTDIADPEEAVRRGARLYESPDLPDHPALAQYAIARPSQIDRRLSRHADDWVMWLDSEQVDRYAVAMDLLVETVQRHGRAVDAIACEVLSTMPRPLGLVLDRSGIGRFRIVQKAELDDRGDVYRADNARPADWVMLGTHDTPSIWAVVQGMTSKQRAQWAEHLGRVLRLPDTARTAILFDPGLLANAMLAEVFASRAENIMMFFTDLFGLNERYNMPGAVSPDNWTLRLPSSFEQLYEKRLARGTAIDLPLALAMALGARGAGETQTAQLVRALRELTPRSFVLDSSTP
ncbi:MAG: 4-alpha-glucanotransferase [Chromatiaceae bacterium]|nr:4-alpha-glucanotransferase [Chromatiaceae bacterium]